MDFYEKTKAFQTYYEEIKLYFLHTFFETLYFAGQRNISVPMEWIWKFEAVIIQEVPDYQKSKYAQMFPLQMELYRMIGKGITPEWLKRYGKIMEIVATK